MGQRPIHHVEMARQEKTLLMVWNTERKRYVFVLHPFYSRPNDKVFVYNKNSGVAPTTLADEQQQNASDPNLVPL